MLAMAAFCLPCVLPLWRAGSVPAARMLMASALLMVAVHAVPLLVRDGSGGHHHAAGPAVAAVSAAAGAEATAALLAVVGWELVVAMLAATWLRRREHFRECRPDPAAPAS